MSTFALAATAGFSPIGGVDRCDPQCPLNVCAVRRRPFPVGASPTRRTLRPEATGAVMEVTKWKTINGLYKAETIHRRGPWRSFEAVEFVTLE
jgi:hypothetical protein